MSCVALHAALCFLVLLLRGAGAGPLQAPSSPSFRGSTADAAFGSFDLPAAIEHTFGGERRRAAEALAAAVAPGWHGLFLTLPKTYSGTVQMATAKYALYRFFLQTHGWRMQGLEPIGEAWTEASLSKSSPLVVGDRMPHGFLAMLEQQLEGRGMSEHELNLLSALIELVIQEHADQQLRASYRLLGLDHDKALPEDAAVEVMAVYMTCFEMGLNVSDGQDVSAEWWQERRRDHEKNNAWAKMKEWPRAADHPNMTEWKFADVGQVLKKVVNAHLRHSLTKFKDVKRQLVIFEGSSSGRVNLGEVYASRYSKGFMFFDERKEFLRQLGALDESNPTEPRLIVPNYLLNPLNCAGPWSYYAVCPLNECEFLLSTLESFVARPEASAARILHFVSNMHSDTVQAPRVLSAALTEKLAEVAKHHRGKVPLHGRLFRQWMHFAFPLECPYPYPADKVRPMNDQEFEDATGMLAYYSEEELANLTAQAMTDPISPLSCGNSSDQCLAMWSPIEELVSIHREPRAFSAASAVAEGPGSADDGGDPNGSGRIRVLLTWSMRALALGLAGAASVDVMRKLVKQAKSALCGQGSFLDAKAAHLN